MCIGGRGLWLVAGCLKDPPSAFCDIQACKSWTEGGVAVVDRAVY